MQRAHIEVDARYEHAKKYGWSHPFTRSGCKIIKELDASKAMEEEVALFKYSFGNGDYVFMTEQAASHKLQIGKIVAEYFGSKANSSYYSVMFGDGEIVEIPMTEFENTAKLFRKRL